MRSRPPIAVALAFALVSAAWAQCFARELTPAEHACCLSMGYDCHAAGMEMECCQPEAAAQSQGQLLAIKSSQDAPVVVSGPQATLPEPRVKVAVAAAAAFSREVDHLPDRPTYLVLSVLLI
jgi:hypothetical protein